MLVINRVGVLGSGPHTPAQFFWTEYPHGSSAFVTAGRLENSENSDNRTGCGLRACTDPSDSLEGFALTYKRL